MLRPGSPFLLAVLASPLMAKGLDLCIENPARLDEVTLRIVREELEAVFASAGRPVRFLPCQRAHVTITLRREAAAEDGSALGRAPWKDGRVAPGIEVFAGPVSALVGSRLPAVLGRALGRVAAHELGHWIGPGDGHSGAGLMSERLTAAHLMAPRRERFLYGPPAHGLSQ